MTPKPHVTFYTRHGCHLCDEARREILAAGVSGDGYTFEEIDIDIDPSLIRRFGLDIPVIVINGTVAFKHRLTAADFGDVIRRFSTRKFGSESK